MSWLDAELRERAVSNHDCPDCGARAGVRCRILTPNITNPKRTKVDVRRKPCAERARLAWRAYISGGGGMTADPPAGGGIAPNAISREPGKASVARAEPSTTGRG